MRLKYDASMKLLWHCCLFYPLIEAIYFYCLSEKVTGVSRRGSWCTMLFANVGGFTIEEIILPSRRVRTMYRLYNEYFLQTKVTSLPSAAIKSSERGRTPGGKPKDLSISQKEMPDCVFSMSSNSAP
jgi:hypothetical protein